jgi:predicted alpha/beta hydrolase family esterase
MKPRIIFIHGNRTTHWSFAWAPWLKQELEANGYQTFFETFPDSVIARSEYWLPFLENHIKAGEHDVIVGWSSGAVAALRYAETHKILGSILISPSVSDLDDELERQSKYFDSPWNWEKIQENQDHIALVYSDNDPFIPQEHFELAKQKLELETIIIPGAGHFVDRSDFPEVLAYILRVYPSD